MTRITLQTRTLGVSPRVFELYAWHLGEHPHFPCGTPRMHWVPLFHCRVGCSFDSAVRNADSPPRMKALLFTLIRSFEFELAIAPDDVVRRSMVVGRPHIAGDLNAGPQLPLVIRPL